MTLDTGPEERGGWINFILVEIRADSVFFGTATCSICVNNFVSIS